MNVLLTVFLFVYTKVRRCLKLMLTSHIVLCLFFRIMDSDDDSVDTPPLNQEANENEEGRHDNDRYTQRDNRRYARTRREAPDPFTLTPVDAEDLIPVNWRNVSISDLMNEGVPRKRIFINLQLLRVVSGSANPETNNGSSTFNYHSRQRRDRQTTSNHQRMFLFVNLIQQLVKQFT